jgi:hypothetical protein
MRCQEQEVNVGELMRMRRWIFGFATRELSFMTAAEFQEGPMKFVAVRYKRVTYVVVHNFTRYITFAIHSNRHQSRVPRC